MYSMKTAVSNLEQITMFWFKSPRRYITYNIRYYDTMMDTVDYILYDYRLKTTQ